MSKKYYYEIHIHECPVCGSSKVYRERVYGEKPTDGSQYHYEQHYDWCES